MKIKNILICGLVLLGMVGCDDFESVNTNPDSTNKVTSAMLATELLRDITTYKNGNGFKYGGRHYHPRAGAQG